MDHPLKYKRVLAFAVALAMSGCAQTPSSTSPLEVSGEKVSGDTQSSSEQAETASPVVTEQAVGGDDETDAELLAEIEAEADEQGDYPVPGVYDPFESFNRVMWGINYDYLDPYIARPVSIAYMDYVPSFLRTGIKNFLANLDEPASMVNSAVMLEGEQAVAHFNRFWINSTFGVAGLIDIASAADIRKPNDREFGDTMGHYGVPNGPYFMVPMYGPITLREGAGDMVDDLYFPLDLLTFWQSLGKWAFEGMESRAALVPQEALLKDSPDPYIFARDAYIQNKNFSATGGVVTEEAAEDDAYLDDYLDEIDAD